MRVFHLNDPECGDAVLVDRRTPWGNPFYKTNNTQAERDRVCDEFEVYAEKRHREDPTWLQPLVGKDLKCWCSPKRCHAETLLRLSNNLGLTEFLED